MRPHREAERSPDRRLRPLLRMGVVAFIGLLGGAETAQAQFFWDQPRYSADDIARSIAERGFQPLSRPTRNDSVYLADVIDRRGRRERLVVNGDSAEIVQRFYLDDRQLYRRYADPSIPRGPVPPGRIPNDDNQPGLFSRLFGGNDEPPTALDGDAPPPPRQRPPRVKRPRLVEQSPDTIRQTPIESAPLAPPSAAPAPLRSPSPPPAAPAQAALPPPAPATPAAPATSAAPDKPSRPISRNPLAIPGSREQDAQSVRPPASVSTAPRPADKPAAPVRNVVPVAPLE